MPTPPDRPTAEPNAAPARTRILGAAIDLFAERGYGSTSMKAVATRAGVSPGLIYTYFDSKDDLLRAVWEEGVRDVLGTLRIEDGGDPVAAIGTLLRSSFAVVEEHHNLWRLLYVLRHQPAVVERLSLELAAWTEAIEGKLRALCERAGVADPATEAKVLFALVDGANQHRLLDPERYPVDAVVEAVTARYAKRDCP